MSSARIIGLTVYPVKGMRGIALDRSGLTPNGLQHDRRFMVVRASGQAVTQREESRLALIEPSFQSGGLQLSMPGAGQIFVPYDNFDGARINTRVWGDACETVDQGDVISGWLTETLDSDERMHLVAMAPGYLRPQGKADLLGANTHTLFADASPYLVANQASLNRLNEELASRGLSTVPMNRFRPNIVIEGLEAFQEHRISSLAVDQWQLRFHHACERCVVTTIDQGTGRRDPAWQPYKTLRDINPVPGGKNAPAFGHNASLVRGKSALIAIGDEPTFESTPCND